MMGRGYNKPDSHRTLTAPEIVYLNHYAGIGGQWFKRAHGTQYRRADLSHPDDAQVIAALTIELNRAHAERDRYKAALTEIANEVVTQYTNPSVICDRARAALKEGR